ncbi:MAG: hypothetical protein DMG48_08440 [Acidobacteria bacterium]|nr:MAG: hypothetical protein DMG48_08440 [Acidobacteriota bacterium]
MPAPWRLSRTVLVCSENILPSMSLPTSRIAISFAIRLLRRTLSGGISTPRCTMVLGILRRRHWFSKTPCSFAQQVRPARSIVQPGAGRISGSVRKMKNFLSPRKRLEVECVSILSKEEAMEQERRREPRFEFVASAEVLSESAGTRLVARISDISVSGCYVDTINPLTDGTPVRLKILTETRVIEARATVVYSHTHLGMGLVFGQVLAKSQDVLQNWLPAAS